MGNGINLLVNLPLGNTLMPPLSLAILKALTPDFKCLDLAKKYNNELYSLLHRPTPIDMAFSYTPSFRGTIYYFDEILRLKGCDFFKQLVEEIKYYEPKIMGFTTNYINMATSLVIAHELHKNNVKVIFGGCGTRFTYRWLNQSFIDHIVVGEAELTWRPLIEGKIKRKVIFPPRIANLDRESPIPDYSDFKIEDYYCMPLETQRGCVNRCAFCTVRNFPYSQVYRQKSPERLSLEIFSLKKYGKPLFLCDNICNPSRKRLRELCYVLEKGKLSWTGEFLPKINESDAYLLKRARCEKAILGCESFCSSALRKMKKPISVSDIISSLRNIKRFEIKAHVMLIIGFPIVNIIEELISFVRVLRYQNLFDTISFSPYYVASGSEVHLNPEEFGIKLLDPSLSYVVANAVPFTPRKQYLKFIADFLTKYFEDKLGLWEL